MPGIISTPKLISDINRANNFVFETINTEEAKLRSQQPTSNSIYKDIPQPFSFRTLFLKRLEVQHTIYSQFENLQSQSLISQIESQFSPDFEQNKKRKLDTCHGIFFVGFDNTLFNTTLFQFELRVHTQIIENVRRCNMRSAQSQTAFNMHPERKTVLDAKLPKFRIGHNLYNGVSRERWHEVLSSLKRKNFLVVLCTKRSAIVGEDEGICKVRRELADCIDREIFMGDIGSKGPLMEHIWYYISDNWKIEFPKQNFYLLDDDKRLHLDPAEALGFSTIQTFATNQVETVQTCSSKDPWYNPILDKYGYYTVSRFSNPQFISTLNRIPNPIPPTKTMPMAMPLTSSHADTAELVPLGSIFHSIQESFIEKESFLDDKVISTTQSIQQTSANFDPTQYRTLPSLLSSIESNASSNSSLSEHASPLSRRRIYRNRPLLMDFEESTKDESQFSSRMSESSVMLQQGAKSSVYITGSGTQPMSSEAAASIPMSASSAHSTPSAPLAPPLSTHSIPSGPLAPQLSTGPVYSSEMKMQQGASEPRVYKREAHTQATSNDPASSFPMSIPSVHPALSADPITPAAPTSGPLGGKFVTSAATAMAGRIFAAFRRAQKPPLAPPPAPSVLKTERVVKLSESFEIID